jgi:hypothetical protein
VTVVRYDWGGLWSNKTITARSCVNTSFEVNAVEYPNNHNDPIYESERGKNVRDSSEVTLDLAVLHLIEEKQEKFGGRDKENENNS